MLLPAKAVGCLLRTKFE
ncbi:hypothetical protein OIU79_000245 [Salix purpurea]|uniref:Uncharacterized protein n=1 Tax=Salix purpurea TaxID=77065 RepID=A0A9Q0V0U7_SALPP|nr:hypothetical protein OIU79_000245 [Salix purpurea]